MIKFYNTDTKYHTNKHNVYLVPSIKYVTRIYTVLDPPFCHAKSHFQQPPTRYYVTKARPIPTINDFMIKSIKINTYIIYFKDVYENNLVTSCHARPPLPPIGNVFYGKKLPNFSYSTFLYRPIFLYICIYT